MKGNRVERHIITLTNPMYKSLDHLCYLSKNLYNATLYEVRQHYFKGLGYLNYNEVNKLFTHQNQKDYRELPAKVSKWTQKLVEQNMKSFFKLSKMKKIGSYQKPVNIPKYLGVKRGRQVVHYEKGAISFKDVGYVKLSKTEVKIATKLTKDQVRFVRVIPKGNHIVIEIGYQVEIKEVKKTNGRYASIDLGVNNLAAVVSNVTPPLIINGKPIKAVNHYYNKRVAELRSTLKVSHNKLTSKRISRCHLKRNNKINDYFHKATRHIVNYLVSNRINTLVIGYNVGWKQNISMGVVNNQKFVQIPFLKFIQQLQYKCEVEGISVELQEEAYTSKCSFYDAEEVCKHLKYKGLRVERGLYKTMSGRYVNADVNGAYNILRKYVEVSGDGLWDGVYLDCIKASSGPKQTKVRAFK